MKSNAMRIAVLGGMTVFFCSGTVFSQTCAGGGMSAKGGGSAHDKMFLMKSSEGGMAEVEMGKIAAEKGSSEDVKSFGQKMVDDHTKLLNDMKPIAEGMGVKPVTHLNAAHQAEAKKLKSLSGESFDKTYIKMMVEDHHKDLKEFKAEESSTKNADLKTAVSQGEQVIQQHTDMIDGIAKKNGIATPGASSM